MRNRLISIFTNPLFITFVFTAVILYFLPDYFTRYKAELIESSPIVNTQKVYYEDLDGDHISEKIYSQTNTLGNASFVIYRENDDIIDQWNFNKKFATNGLNLQFFDRDKDGYKEIYLATQENDSVFFNSIEPLHKNNEERTEFFIDTIKPYDHKYQVQTAKYKFDRHIKIPQESVFIEINCGHSGYPRNLYKINTETGTVVQSPYLVNHGFPNYLADLDNDGKSEFMFTNASSCNSLDSTMTKRSDYSSWLTVLDDDLNFLFEPVELKSPYSVSRTIPLKDRNGNYKIICVEDYKKKNDLQDKLFVYSLTGRVIRETTLQRGKYQLYPGENESDFYLFNLNNGQISFFDCDLKEKKTLFVDPKRFFFPLDINKDGENEWVSYKTGFNEIKIYRAGFVDPVKILLPKGAGNTFKYGIKEMKNSLNELYFQKGSNYYVYKYGENPLYFFKYLFYLTIFLSIWGMLWLARKGQQIKMEKQRAIEDQISQLQIKTLKNQVDPHFVFNAVNTISEMILTDNKLEADRFISKFSKLMRETLQKSDKISTSLQEELDYVENYIQLQRTRFDNRFEYQIKKDLNVDYKTQVPNHVIYSYVENAIKHGLRNRKDGLLSIIVQPAEDAIRIAIENNGGGIDHFQKQKKNSTGNGLKIMEKMYALYEKIYHKKITHQITEIKEKNGKISGVRVEIIISA